MHTSSNKTPTAISSRPGFARSLATATALAAALALAPESQATAQDYSTPADYGSRDSSYVRPVASPLLDKVRAATMRFRDIKVAMSEGWVRGTPCVSGPNSGAMGVHFLMPSRVGDGAVNANEPEALIYEPAANGAMRLVGVEFIVLAADWALQHPDGSTPVVDGHLTNYVGAPNRYGLPAFYELHVWAWENNPNGSFADFNSRVTCEYQSGG